MPIRILTNKTYALPPTMNPEGEVSTSAFSAHDILYAVFKHKWKVLLGILISLTVATIYYRSYPTAYQSEAKLLVRYVLDRSPVDPIDGRPSEPRGPNGPIDRLQWIW